MMRRKKEMGKQRSEREIIQSQERKKIISLLKTPPVLLGRVRPLYCTI